MIQQDHQVDVRFNLFERHSEHRAFPKGFAHRTQLANGKSSRVIEIVFKGLQL
jgi:hypothetical protein